MLESHSDWPSLVLLVPKEDGSVHFYMVFRKLNTLFKYETYPMPCIDGLLNQLAPPPSLLVDIEFDKGILEDTLDSHIL